MSLQAHPGLHSENRAQLDNRPRIFSLCSPSLALLVLLFIAIFIIVSIVRDRPPRFEGDHPAHGTSLRRQRTEGSGGLLWRQPWFAEPY
jgi:hypothetical protein